MSAKSVNVLAAAGIYIVLTAIFSLWFGEFSLRHTLFFFAMAVLTVWGANFFAERRRYFFCLLAGMVLIVSLIALRTQSTINTHIWDGAIFLGFGFALLQVILSIIGLFPRHGKSVIAFLLYWVIVLPVLLLWGYYFAENSWMSAMGGLALVQTNFSEAAEYVMAKIPVFFMIILPLTILTGIGFAKTANGLSFTVSDRRTSLMIAVFVFLNIVLLVRTRDNIVYHVYKETREFVAQYDAFNQGVNGRKGRLEEVSFDRAGAPGLYVLVIGESANRDHMSAYGYDLETTPWLSKMKNDPQMLLFDHGYSCHLFTVPTLSYALTTKNQYNEIDLEDAVSVIEVANKAGYDTAWVSNQLKYSVWNTPISVIADASNQQIWTNSHVGSSSDTDDYDMVVVDAIDRLHISDNMLLVVHLMGSHLSYHDRYPKDFDVFHTAGRHAQFNEYDNSVLYNDFVMQKLVEKVSSFPNFQCLLYFSDHSVRVDAPGASGIDHFHYAKTRIPMYIYFSPAFREKRGDVYERIRSLKGEVITDDLVFNMILGLMDIRPAFQYEPQNDITNSHYDANQERFRTMYGKYSIKDDPALQQHDS